MNKRIPILLAAMILAQSCLMSRAQSVPEQMNYQGVIADSSGVPLPDGDYELTFRIFDVATAGEPVWGPRAITTTVVDGQFNVALGPLDQATPTARELSAGFASANSYLEIQVDTNPAIAPRQKILSAPFAFEAAHAATLGGTPETPAITSSGAAVSIPGTVTAGSFSGNGSGLSGLTAGQVPSLDASKITSGTIADGRLSGNVALLNRTPQAFSGAVNSFAGNVGIGTQAPARKLTVLTDSNDYGIEHTDGDVRFGTFIGPTSGVDGGWLGTWSNHPLYFFVNDNDVAMTLNTSGELGIGTRSPNAKLHIKGTGNAFPATAGATQSAGHVARFESVNGVTLDIGLNSSSGSWLQTTFNGAHTFNYPLLLNPNGGNVGIGTTAPSGKLSVVGQVTFGAGGGEFSAVGSGSETLRIVRGTVDGNGDKARGAGFTSVRTGLGTYQITFNPALADFPTITANSRRVAATVAVRFAGTTIANIEVHVPTIGNVDDRFHFIAVSRW